VRIQVRYLDKSLLFILAGIALVLAGLLTFVLLR
jgi:hypothetical protein